MLVLVAARLDERRTLTKRLLASATVVRCGVLETVADAQRWIRAAAKAQRVRISDAAVRALGERTGPDIRRLRDEMERLVLFAADADEISIGRRAGRVRSRWRPTMTGPWRAPSSGGRPRWRSASSV